MMKCTVLGSAIRPHTIHVLAVVVLLTSAACAAPDPDMQVDDGTGGAAAPASGAGTGGAGSNTMGSAATGMLPSDNAGKGGAVVGTGGAGSAGSAGTAAGSGGGGAASSGGMTAGDAGIIAGAGLPPRCKSSPSQMIVLGDSYLNWLTHTFPEDLTREAGEEWRMYAVGGCSLGSGGLCLIPPQLDDAIAEDPDIIAGIMTGGGNDILIADEALFPGSTECKDRVDSPTVQVCQDVVTTAIDAGEKLMQTAADAGIRDVIYLFYPHIPGGGFGGTNPNALLDYALPKARALCDEAEMRTKGELRCHFIDLVPLFDGHPDWFADDGIHENELGSAAMAKKVLEVAEAECIAQPASSGCCEP